MSAASQDTLSQRRLDSIIVSTSRAGVNTPVANTTLGKGVVERVPSTYSLPMMLNMLPSVVSTTEGGLALGYSNMRVRGSDASRTNVTLNGIAINDGESQEVIWANIPSLPNFLQSVQLQRGAGTSANGPGAFGASLNMQTKTPSFEPYANVDFSAGSYKTFMESIALGTGSMKSVGNGYFSADLAYNHAITRGYIRNAKANLINSVSAAEAAAQAVSSKVDRFPALMTAAIQGATSLITGQTGGYVVIHTDSENGQPYELLVMDAPDIASAVNIWRWNVGGLGFSHNGYNGPFETAITSDGQIVADFITAGSLAANIIKAGVLSSQDGSSYWDLETGEVVLRAYATTESVIETNERITEIEEQKMYRLVITSSNGNIFKNNNIQTTLSAVVFSWDTNVTDSLDPNQFIWTRVSDDPVADQAWNDAHFGGTKSINITRDDVNVRATFFCDLIDTTTRNSLLG